MNDDDRAVYAQNVGRRFATARKIAGLTAAEAARKLGIARTSLFNYETGKKLPKADVVRDACILYRVSCDYLLALVDERSFLGPVDPENPYHATEPTGPTAQPRPA